MIQLDGQGVQSGGTIGEVAPYGVDFDLLERGGGAIGADVGAGAFTVVCQPDAVLRIVHADRVAQQAQLTPGVVDQRGKHFAHQLFIIQRDVFELVKVQYQRRVGDVHDFILRWDAATGESAERLNSSANGTYLGRTPPKRKLLSITCPRESTTALTMKPGSTGEPKRISNTSTKRAFSRAG